jgi:hypothetical protein
VVGAAPVGASIVGAAPAAPVTSGLVVALVVTFEFPLLVGVLLDGVLLVACVEAVVPPPLVVQPAKRRADEAMAVSARARYVNFI